MRRLLESRKVAVLVGVLVAVLFAICIAAIIPRAGGTGQATPEPAAPAANESDPANRVDPQQTPDSSFLYDTSISSLMSADAYMDGQTVQVVGEVVGDRIRAEDEPDFCWIALQSPTSPNDVVMVYLSRTLTQHIDTYGAYGKRGTTLQVRGTFNLACADHEGLSDLHAEHSSVVRKGAENPDPFRPQDFIPGAVLLALAGGLFFLFWRIRESNR
ncbi:MAG: hydrolase [Eggerthellaceae bacterium]|jgi:hypothetical protein|nr:hydrolase [Eggerthellaceae bacterium]